MYANGEEEDMVMKGGTWNKPSGHKNKNNHNLKNNKKKLHESDEDDGMSGSELVATFGQGKKLVGSRRTGCMARNKPTMISWTNHVVSIAVRRIAQPSTPPDNACPQKVTIGKREVAGSL